MSESTSEADRTGQGSNSDIPGVHASDPFAAEVTLNPSNRGAGKTWSLQSTCSASRHHTFKMEVNTVLAC